jgi:hypothetical protein
MNDIFNCKKTDAGVALVWRERGKENQELFSFPELEEMRIDVQDMVEHPDLYRIDLQEHKIYRQRLTLIFVSPATHRQVRLLTVFF